MIKKTLLLVFCTPFLLFSIGFGQVVADTICNVSFEDSLNSWVSFTNGGGVATFDVTNTETHEGLLAAMVDVTDATGSVILRSCKGDLEGGKKYLISFWAKSQSGIVEMRASTSKNTTPFTNYGQVDISISDQWTQYSFLSFSEDDLIADAMLLKFKWLSVGVTYIDDISWEKLDAYPVICNYGFESDLDDWNTASANGANATFGADSNTIHEGAKSCKVDVQVLGSTSTSILLSSCKSDIQAEKKYKISFWARTETETLSSLVTSALSVAPYTIYGSLSFTMTPSWKKYSYAAISDSTIHDNVRLFKMQFESTGVYYIDAIEIEEVDGFPELCDGGFENGLGSWTQTVNGTAMATIDISTSNFHEGQQSAEVVVTTPGATASNIQLASCKSDLLDGLTYTVSFWGKTAQGSAEISAISGLAVAPFNTYGGGAFTLSTNWKQYVYTFSADTTVIGEVRWVKFQFSNPGTFYIDKVELLEGTVTVGVEEPNVLIDLKLYPNPAQKFLIVETSLLFNRDEMRIIDMLGNEFQLEKEWNGLNTRLNLEPLSPGVYFLELNSGNIHATRKFVISR